MKYSELAGMKQEDLIKKQHEVTLELIKLKAQVATGTTPKSPGQIKQLKRVLARIEMINHQQKEVHERDARD